MKIEKQLESIEDGYFSFVKSAVRAEVELDEEHHHDTIIGIDPGTANLGVAILYDSALGPSIVYKFKVDRQDTMLERIYTLNNILHHLAYKEDLFNMDVISHVIIEGASFGATHRQVELAEQRVAAALWFITRSMEYQDEPKIYLVPPKKIRSVVFGNGDTLAEDEWKDLPKDGATALSCALYAMMKGHRLESSYR
jgi:Holliday junction resolvasome RuvABC endonuclease subunit